MKHTLAILLLVLVCAPGMAQTKPTTGQSSTVTTAPLAQPTTLQPGIFVSDVPTWKLHSDYQITWSTSSAEYTALWLTVSRDETKVGWLIPTCTTANLKRAPKLTAWVVGTQAYSSPQAKWLSALFKACEIQ